MTVVLLGAAVLLWVAGFDIIYACQDYEFDVKMRLRSLPARFGVAAASFDRQQPDRPAPCS